MNAARRAAAACVVVASVLLLWPAALPADPPDAAGWWWKPQVTPLVPVPKPPTVPDGGLFVAADPSGPFGVSAVRYVAPKGGEISRLTLRIASSQGLVAVRACPSEITWTPEQGGPIASVPPHDCLAGSVPGALDAAGTAVVFEVGPLVRDGVLNVVVTSAAAPSAFQAAFAKPGDDAVTVTTPSSSTTDTTMAPPDYSYLEGPAFTDTGPLIGEPLPPPVGVDMGPTPSTTPTTVAARQTGPRRVPRPQLAAKARRDPDRVAAAVVLVGLAGVFMWVAERPGRLPRLIGPMGALAGGAGPGRPVQRAESPVAARGVGRFRRPRTGPPPRL